MDFMRYTREELRVLLNYIDKECGGRAKMFWGLQIRNSLRHCVCSPFQLSNYPFDVETDFDLFTIEIHHLPLYINDKDPEKAAIAKWRLSRGE